jgi:hypothetical protein
MSDPIRCPNSTCGGLLKDISTQPVGGYVGGKTEKVPTPRRYLCGRCNKTFTRNDEGGIVEY